MMEKKTYLDEIKVYDVSSSFNLEEMKRMTKLTDKEFAVFMWGFENGMEKNPQDGSLSPFLMGMISTFVFFVFVLLINEGIKHGF